MYKKIFIPLLFFTLTIIYLFPLLQGLMLLPLDLLISNYLPWYSPGTILLKNPYMQDSIIQLFPWRHLVFQSLTQGIIPLWNPYQFLGMPFMANLKPMVFYPLNIFFLLGEKQAWNMLLFSQLFLAMIFAYYLARDFKLKFFPSIMVSFAFALNSYMIGLLEFGSDAHTLIWFPLILLFSKRYLEQQKRRYLFLTGLVISFSIFAGQLQYLAYFMILLVGFIFYYGRKLKAKISVSMLLLLAILLGFGISCLQLLPSLELFSNSHRGLLSVTQKHEAYSNSLMQPYRALRLFAPDIFGNPVSRDETWGYIEACGYFGIIPLFFAVFAMIFARKNFFVKFFTSIFIISFLLSLKGFGEILYFLKIPIITSGQADRISTLVLFSGSLLSGFGLMEFTEAKNKRKFFSVIGFSFLYLLLLVFYGLYLKQISGPLESMIQNVKFSLFIIGMFLTASLAYIFFTKIINQKKLIKALFLFFVIFITFFDLFRLGYRFLTFSNEKFLYPQMPVNTFIQNKSQTALGRTFGLTEPELGTYLNVYTIETYNPLYLLRTAQLLQALQDQSLQELTKDNKYFLSSLGDNLKYAIDFVGVEYIVATKDENPSIKYFNTNKFEKDLTKIYTDDRYSVYKNLSAYPRFGLYYKPIIISDDQKILNTIRDKKIDLKNNIILEEKLPIELQAGTGSVKYLSSNVNNIIFETNSSQPAIFYLSDSFYPGWSATVNSKNTKIYRANYNFRAVLVPKGKSTVSFTYMPLSFRLGIYISVLSLLILIFVSVKAPIKKAI